MGSEYESGIYAARRYARLEIDREEWEILYPEMIDDNKTLLIEQHEKVSIGRIIYGLQCDRKANYNEFAD